MNKTILSGVISSDLVPKKTKTNREYVAFNLACEKDFIGKDGKRAVEYFRIIAWNALVQELMSNAARGYKVLVEGHMSSRSYDDPNTKEKKYITEVVADKFDYIQAVNQAAAQGCTSTPFSAFGEEIPF